MKKLLVLLAITAGGCASMPTSYGPMGTRGGYQEIRRAPDEFRVMFGGNAYTPGARVSDYALLRAAELTLQAGYTHFEVIKSDDISRKQTFLVAGKSFSDATAFRNGNTVQAYGSTTTMPAHEATEYYPGRALTIKLAREADGDKRFNAAELADELRAKHHLPKRR